MTLLHLSAAIPAWIAVAFRVWLTYRLPQQPWRRSFTLAMVLAATGYTTWGIPSGALGSEPGVFGREGLLGTVGLMSAALALHWYVSNLRQDSPTLRSIAVRIGAGVAGCVVLVALFPYTQHASARALAPDVTGNWANLLSHWIYGCIFTLTLAETAFLCLGPSGYRTQLDRSGRAGVQLVGWGCAVVAGITVIGLFFWTYDFFSTDLAGVFRRFDFLQPVAMWLLSVGVLVAGAGHYVGRWRRARKVQRLLRPLWRDLTARCPAVVLPASTSGSPLKRAEMGSERARVEIRDALEMLCLPAQAARSNVTADRDSVAAVARVLRHDVEVQREHCDQPCILSTCLAEACRSQTRVIGVGAPSTSTPLSRLLPDVPDRDAALQQLVGLAKEYQSQ